jgi:hypothetical protein
VLSSARLGSLPNSQVQGVLEERKCLLGRDKASADRITWREAGGEMNDGDGAGSRQDLAKSP